MTFNVRPRANFLLAPLTEKISEGRIILKDNYKQL
jgi:hypothetical protein